MGWLAFLKMNLLPIPKSETEEETNIANIDE
jgi:hypothetical protein